MSKGMGSHHNRHMEKDEWLTPPHILKALGPFDLDPCAPRPENRPWQIADVHYHENGLLLPWHGFVWVNPPYNGQEQFWLNKLILHRDNNNGGGLVLIFARTETAIWENYIWPKADAILFLYGRLTFYHTDGTKGKYNGGAPSAIIAYGQEAISRLQYSKLKGKIVYLNHTKIPF